MRTAQSRHVMVTGGASGAGLVIARAFAAVGYGVSACDVDRAALDRLAADDPAIMGILADVGFEEQIVGAHECAVAHHGPVDTLVNNVGIGLQPRPIEYTDLADWNRVLAVNLTSHFLFIRAVVPAMKTAGAGAIINISSASAKVGLPGRSSYVVSKSGVLSLTQTLARELGPDGIRVNAILPGAIRGERIARVINEKAALLQIDPQEFERNMLRYISLRTMVEPDDIAAMAVFLASSAGSRISGQMIGVDGGVEWEE